MEAEANADATRALIDAWRMGDEGARDRLIALFYPDLERVAAGMLRGEQNVSLASGDLVHETVLRLVATRRIAWQDRAHFMALSARMMRHALIDHVRAKRRGKRAHHRVELRTNIPGETPADIEDINDALERLALVDSEHARIVEMRFFGGMDISDIATVLDCSESTVKRRWNAARLWLVDALMVVTR